MSKKQAVVGILVLALVGAGVAVLWNRPQVPSVSPRQDVELAGARAESAVEVVRSGAMQESLEASEDPSSMEPPENFESARTLSESEAKRIRQVVSEQQAFPHEVLMDEYKAELWADIQSQPPALRPLNDPDVDADLAYRLYMYYGNCSVMPRTQAQIDSRLNQLAERAEHASARSLDRIERNADRMINSYEFCAAIPAEVDPRLEAIHWMARAVQLGHEIAQVQYYEKAMGFLLRTDRMSETPPLVMLQSGIISEFKANARMALDMAMQKGHPEAYLAMAEAMLDGVIYQRDPVMAMAYLRAAQSLASQNQLLLRGLEHLQYRASQELTAEQVAQAEKLAMDLELGIRG